MATPSPWQRRLDARAVEEKEEEDGEKSDATVVLSPTSPAESPTMSAPTIDFGETKEEAA